MPSASACIYQINIGCKCFMLLMKKMHTNNHRYRKYILKIDAVSAKKHKQNV